MITALLLPLLVFGTPADGAVRATGGDDPAIQIWISNDRRFLPGDRAKVQVRTHEDGYLLVLHADPDGHLRVLFPVDPGDDNFVRGGHKYEIRGRGGRESFTVDDHRGRGTVYAAVSRDPYRFDQFVLGDHWDYRNLEPQRLSANPEQELNELVRRMADNSFDYDILTYDVLERVVYASEYNSDYYGYDGFYGGSYGGAYGGCAYSYFGCGRSYYGSPYSVSIGLFFGRPFYRRSYFDPFYAGYDPFYDPFFYDPYYYRPFYYQPYYYRPYYYRPVYAYPYGGYYYNHYYYGWNRPYAPYRFRTAVGGFAGYRDRRFDFGRSVNTVYMPPVVRGRQPETANPIRRMTGPRPAEDARPVVERRTKVPVGDAGAARRASDQTVTRGADRDAGRRRAERRLTAPSIDARRARGPEEVRSIIPDSRERRDARNLPTEIRPSRSDNSGRRAMDRPEEVRGVEARPAPRVDARPSRIDDDRSSDRGYSRPDSRAEPRVEPRRAEPQAEPQRVYRPEPRSSDRGGDRGGYSPPQSDRGGDRGSYSPPPRSSSSDGGGSRGGGNGGGGFRRR